MFKEFYKENYVNKWVVCGRDDICDGPHQVLDAVILSWAKMNPNPSIAIIIDTLPLEAVFLWDGVKVFNSKKECEKYMDQWYIDNDWRFDSR